MSEKEAIRTSATGFGRSRIGVAVIRDDAILRANGTLARKLGVGLDDLQGQYVSDLIDGGDGEFLIPLLAKFGARRSIVPTRRIILKHPDGSTVAAEAMLLATIPDTILGFEFDDRQDRTDIDAERYRSIYENAAEGIYMSSLDGIQLSANPTLVRLNGYDSEEEMLFSVNNIAQEWYVLPERRAEFQTELREHGVVRDFVSEIYRHKTRERIWISENARLVTDAETSEPLHYEGTVSEVTGRMALITEKERHAKIVAQAPGLLFQSRMMPGEDAEFTYISDGIVGLCGLEADAVMKTPLLIGKRIHPDDRTQLFQSIVESAKSMLPWNTDFRMRRMDGVDIWVGGKATPELQDDGSIVWHGFITDITERREAQERIAELAYCDSLTGLPNRVALIDEAGRAMARGAKAGRAGALFFIDLDNFKNLNDLHGHGMGDQLLRLVADRLTAAVAGRGCVARFGGDEFVVLVENLKGNAPNADAMALARSIHKCLSEPFALKGVSHRTTPSIGLELFFGTAMPLEELLKRADVAMYSVKSSGRNGVARFDEKMQQAIEDEARFHADVREALDSDALELHLQPLVSARGGHFLGAEALLRWFHPTRGAVRPDLLVEAAEEMGICHELQRWVLRRACAVIRRWESLPEFDGATVSVNVSPTCLQQADFVDQVMDILNDEKVCASRMVLEITEHGVLDDMEGVIEKLNQLRAFGLRFALDDFGTGYSSLTYLKHLPLDEVKIDRSFVQNLDHDEGDRAIVDATLAVARKLGLAVTAEGVERVSHARHLNAQGCAKLQGFLFSRAIAPDDLEIWVARHQELTGIAQAV